MDKYDEMARELLIEWYGRSQPNVSVRAVAKALAQVEAETLERAARFMEQRSSEIARSGSKTARTVSRIYRDDANIIRSLTANEKLTPAKLADGYVRVPREATKEMLEAALSHDTETQHIYVFLKMAAMYLKTTPQKITAP